MLREDIALFYYICASHILIPFVMKKIVFALSFVIALSSCKPGSGPLERDAFSKSEKNAPVGQKDNKSAVKIEKVNVKVQPCDGCISIKDLLANKKDYSGKAVKVSGQVTKFNPSIMGKNWIHIQDGTEFNGDFDLTITTDKSVTVGETITYEGIVSLDKDFGYGYFYKILLEGGEPAL
jgi:hypothetical protein